MTSRHTRLLLQEMLRNTEWPNAEFADGVAAAIKLIQGNQPDIVFTDWKMPGETGLDLIRAIRERADLSDPLLPVILLTASSGAEHVLGARKAGANDFLVKPISMARIAERVMSAVTKPRGFIVSPSYTGPDWRRPASTAGGESPDPLPADGVVIPPDFLLLAKVRGDPVAIREAKQRRAKAIAIVAAAFAATPSVVAA